MDITSRQTELTTIFDKFTRENPQIVDALEIFEIGQEQYVSAIAQMNSAVIVSSTTTNQGVNNAKLDCNQS